MSPELQRQDGLLLVRRFTGDLEGNTTLERAAISAQQQQDAIEQAEKALRRRRMEALYREPGRDPSDFGFHEMEAARLALQKACKQVETADGKPSPLAKLGFQRKSARATANDAVLSSSTQDFKGLQAVVESFEVGQRFRKICQKLDDHKAAFALFPSQNLYTSVLCGSLTLIVGAAVNHNEIAEKLSKFVAEITDKATRAANMVMIYRTESFRDLFSDLYAQVFHFYRQTIEWYAKSKVSKALDSFNANLMKPYEEAATKIEGLVVEIYRQAEVAKSAQLTVFVEDFEDRLRDQRAQYTDRDDLVFAGQQSRRLMFLMHERALLEDVGPRDQEVGRIEIVEDRVCAAEAEDLLDRAGAAAQTRRIETFIVGSEGPSLFKDGRMWLPESNVSSRLGEWTGPDTAFSTLWITSPVQTRGFPGSRAAALITLVAAWESKLPIVSHFCARPYHGNLAEGRSVEQVGLLGMVYSLIIQLLQFKVEDDVFQISEGQLEKLDGSDDSWPGALHLLQHLLQATPQVQRCVIDDLNELCSSSGAEWCSPFLRMLFDHQRTSASGFKILLTTSGQSRVLPSFILDENRVLAQSAAREVVRGGRWLGETKEVGR